MYIDFYLYKQGFYRERQYMQSYEN